MPVRARATAIVIAAALAAGLSGCSVFGGAGTASTQSAAPSAAPLETTEPEATEPVVPTLDPDASAGENLPFFDATNTKVIAANAEAKGGDFISALTDAGFDPTVMEVTADRTTVDLEADSVQFAVAFQGECLIGQYGPKSGGYHSDVRALLGSGDCLVSATG